MAALRTCWYLASSGSDVAGSRGSAVGAAAHCKLALPTSAPSHCCSMFVILSFIKIFHWLVQDRVDFIETTPNVTRLQHARIASFALVLLVGVGGSWVVWAPSVPWALAGLRRSRRLRSSVVSSRAMPLMLAGLHSKKASNSPSSSHAHLPLAPVPSRTALQALDLAFLQYSLSKTLASGVSVHLLFAFEYTVQASTIIVTFAKYCM